MSTFYLVLVFFIGSIGVSALANYLVLNFAKTLGIRNKNQVTIRWSRESKPSLGGISMYLVFIITGLIIALLIIDVFDNARIQFLGLFLAATLGFAMGIADDAYDTKPYFKLFIQILCGVTLVLTDNSVQVTSMNWLNGLFTIFWVVALMNSLNMLDNMDGITGVVTTCVLASCLVVYGMTTGWILDVWMIVMITSIGTMIGFLLFNVYPSKLFMGDGGSQFVGVIVAFFTAKCMFIKVENSLNLQGIILALVVLTPTIADTLSVVINRLRKGKSPMVGGKDHTTHHLVYSGLSERQVWMVFLVIGLLSGLGALGLFIGFSISEWGMIFIGSAYFVVVFAFLYRNTIKYQSK